ncbi:hypothetical protein DFP72DRAFT_353441 [Ephemerocybe angulata]|uniref:Uncharacterized protein n=1 Tax=Ephemerocybe angulata TaxID=980116 RepID=A0A8H6M898_9AGAR|nr:hypothetical protein DFP72DRAFT_353441 [Tulosesus angulatus]
MDAHNDPLYFPHHPDFHLAFSTLDPRKHVPGDTVFVCNPPRERPWPTIHAHDPFALTCTDDDPDLDFYRTLYVAPPKMPKTKRRSVQSVLVPTFLQGSSSRPTSPDRDSFRAATPTPTTATPAKRSSRIRAHSSAASIGRWSLQVLGPPAQQQQLPPSTSTSTSTLKGAVLSPPTSPPPPISSDRDSPPPDFLLDDDPFANLTAAPVVSRASTPTPTAELPVPPTPRSPLMTVEEEEGLKETVINPISLACASSADKLVFKTACAAPRVLDAHAARGGAPAACV